MGKGPRDAKCWIIDDMIIVRMTGTLLPIEKQLLEGTTGIEMVKTIRKAVHEINTHTLNTYIEKLTKHKVISTHTDVSTKTGERFEAFILDGNYEAEFRNE